MRPDLLNWVTQEILAGAASRLSEYEVGYYAAMLKVYRHLGVQHFSENIRTTALELQSKIDKHTTLAQSAGLWEPNYLEG